MALNLTREQQILLLLIVIALLTLLIGAGYPIISQLYELDRQLISLLKCQEIAVNINHLATSMEEYFLYEKPESLSESQRYLSQTLKSEWELYNLASQPEKTAVEELIVLTRSYNSFIEKELLPSGLTSANRQEVELLRQQSQDLTRRLLLQVAATSETTQKESGPNLQDALTAVRARSSFVIFLSLLSFGTVLGLLFLFWLGLNEPSVLHHLVDYCFNAVMVIDRQERLKYINQAALRLFQLQRDMVAGKTIEEILRLFPHLQTVMEPVYQVLYQKEQITGYRVNYFGEKAKLSLAIDYIPVFIRRRPVSVALMVRDASERNEHALLEIMEAERKRISTEIHDWIGRYMSTIIHGLDFILRTKQGQLSPAEEENILMLRTHCQKAAIDMRNIMNDIHPYLIEKVGFIQALESYIANFERIHNRKVYLYYQKQSLPLNIAAQINVYRIIQEALTNVAKHSAATEIDIYFSDNHENITIEIIDNGGIKETPPIPGKGLWGMTERARLIGGQLSYGYKDGGFCITLTLPKKEGMEDGKDQNHAGGRS